MQMIQTIQTRLAAAQSVGQPKYRLLCNAITGAISNGDWTPGMQLPTEAELARMLPYSLGTVQKAYGELVRSGLVVRARGRGSCVAPSHQQMADPLHCRFLADDGTILPIYPRLLGHNAASKDPRWTALFGPKAQILRIERIISVNEEFEVLNRFYSLNAIATQLLRLPRDRVETANFKIFLMRELGMPISRITQTIGMADKQIWRKLGIGSRPHLVLEATAYLADGEVAYFQENYIPPNNRKLSFDSELR